jgi:alpha-glucosidase (family GH31 glycosyl hydrolase)
MYFLFGESPTKVTKMYHSAIVGSPVMTPRWALGWHHCKYGYTSTQDLIDNVGNYSSYNLPLDTQWVDIDYMHDYEDFDVEETKFGGLSDFITDLHTDNQHFIPIVDAGIRKSTSYEAYNSGLNQSVFIMSAGNTAEPFVGQVWPGDSVYPDFMAPNTASWWKEHISTFYSNISFDGLWLDMNEASNFCTGACYPEQEIEMT